MEIDKVHVSLGQDWSVEAPAIKYSFEIHHFPCESKNVPIQKLGCVITRTDLKLVCVNIVDVPQLGIMWRMIRL
jgi:hypothetical protein